MGGSAAFFDLDKTVIAKSSAMAFGRPFYRDGLINRRDVIKGAYGKLLQRMGGSDEIGMARTRDYLAELCKGWRVEQVEQIVQETLEELITPYVYAEAAALIGEHRAAGRDVILVSGSGDVMVKPIGEALGITDVIASRMVVHDGCYTGDIDFYAAGENKVTEVQKMAAERGYDLAESFAYSDSITDVPLLSCVGHPTAVNPDRALRRVATERGWPMLEFRHPVPLSRPVARAAGGAGYGGGAGRGGRGSHRPHPLGAGPQSEGGAGLAYQPVAAYQMTYGLHRPSRPPGTHERTAASGTLQRILTRAAGCEPKVHAW